MADQIKKLSAGHTAEVLDGIMSEVEEARGEYESLDARFDEISGEGYSKAEADALLALKQNALNSAQLAAVNSGINSEKVAQYDSTTELEAKDRAALVELVDSGAKNLSDWDGGAAATDSSFVVQNEPITLKKATYAISFDTTANSGRCEIVFRDSNGVVGSYTFDNTSSSTLSAEITLTADAVKFDLFTTKAATITNFMICTKAAWDISHKYQPYRPSYQELTERTTIYTVESSLFSYVNTLSEGIHFAMQKATTGTDKPVSGKRYMYQIFVYNSYFATIIAYECQSTNAPIMYIVNKENGTWGSWFKFEGIAVT